MKKFILNTVSPLLVYTLVLLLGLVVSQVFLIEYGSEVNGLFSSVNQIFTYMALLEAGIGTATVTALYKPLMQKDDETANSVLSASNAYYRRMTVWYILAVFAISVIWPLVLKTTISFAEIFFLIFIQGISSSIAFYFTAAITNYLVASGKSYVNNNILLVSNIVTYTLKLVVCCLHLNIIYISVSLLLVNFLKCVIYGLYVKKCCRHIKPVKNADKSLLKEKNSFLVHEISGVIFSSTDTIIISIFCGLKEASIYATYSLVLNALNAIISQIFNGTNYILGNRYAENESEYYKAHDIYNTVYICGVFALYTVAYVLLPHFIWLYTKDVSDISYLDPHLPMLFVLAQLLSSCRNVDNKLIRISLNAKATIGRSLFESAINIVVSIVLVNAIGMYGVLIGTIVALLYRSNDMIIYSNRKILKRSPLKEYKLYLVNFLTFFGFYFLSKKITFSVETYFDFFIQAVLLLGIVSVVFVLINVITNYKTVFRKVITRKGTNK